MTTYKDAGVDIKAGDLAVKRISSLAKSTFNANTLSDIGSFGGCYNFPKDKYKEPVLVSSADGVGTKLKIAFLSNRHNTIGQCLVNHCVNDILVSGAEPMLFLDYFASSKLDNDEALFEAMSDYPKLMERPIVVKGLKACIGRPPEKILEIIFAFFLILYQ